MHGIKSMDFFDVNLTELSMQLCDISFNDRAHSWFKVNNFFKKIKHSDILQLLQINLL